MNIFELGYVNFIMTFDKLDEDKQLELVNDPNFLKCDIKQIVYVFKKGSIKTKESIVNNSSLVEKLLKSCIDKVSKFNIFDFNDQKLIIKHPEAFINFKNNELGVILSSMPDILYKECINNINNYLYKNNPNSTNDDLKLISDMYNDIKNEISNSKNYEDLKFNIIVKTNTIDSSMINNLMKKFCDFDINGIAKRNILQIYKIDTYNQLYIFDKFDLVVDESIFSKEKYNEYQISMDLIKQLNGKHLNKIFDKLKTMGEASETEIFITGYKMYCLFGLDNSLKILNNKFTYDNNKSLTREADLKFTKDRREYRVKNPDEFFKYQLVEKLQKSIHNNDTRILRNLKIGDEHLINSVFNELKVSYQLNKDDEKFYHYLSETIKYVIAERENSLRLANRKNYINEFGDYKREPLNVPELFNLFGKFDVEHTKFDIYNNTMMDKSLEQFLLGNTKSDNDCLLRMVFNNNALDYNTELINVVNNYYYINTKLKENNLNSPNSLLGILEVYKIIEYNLTTDEIDIPLKAISKTILSNDFVQASKKEIIDQLKLVYKESKKKYCSSIPLIDGTTKDGYSYKVLTKNDDELLTIGIDTKCCLRPGSIGGDFYKFCLTNPNGGIIEIKDDEENTYIVPLVRIGNGLYGNGIEPNYINKEKIPFIKKAIVKCYNEIIKKSYNEEKIEFCTLSNLHGYIDKNEFKQISLTDIEENVDFYCDLFKGEIKNYIIAGDYNKKEIYDPKMMFETKRFQNYLYTKDQRENRTIIEDKVNEICYKSIDCMPISDLEKADKKENFNPIDITKYDYIICNEDWFILSNDYEVKTMFLPYDPRAQEELLKEFKKLMNINDVKNKIKWR